MLGEKYFPPVHLQSTVYSCQYDEGCRVRLLYSTVYSCQYDDIIFTVNCTSISEKNHPWVNAICEPGFMNKQKFILKIVWSSMYKLDYSKNLISLNHI